MAIRTETTPDGHICITCTVCEVSQELDEEGLLLVQITEFARQHRHADTEG